MPITTCPQCEGAMKVMARGDVFVDVCPSCRGVWLDGGELEKLLADTRAHEEERLANERAASGGSAPRAAPPDVQQRGGHDAGGGKKKRKKGWFDLGDMLEDLFD